MSWFVDASTQAHCVSLVNQLLDTIEPLPSHQQDGREDDPWLSWYGVGLPALTGRWFESLLVHSGVSSATRRKATGADHKK